MADEQDQEQKQHAPTGKRLGELSEKGDTLRSKDLSGGMLLFASVLLLLFMEPYFKSILIHNFRTAFRAADKIGQSPESIFIIFKSMVLDSFTMLLPFFIIIYIVPFLSVFILGGWNFSLKALRFRWEMFDLFNNVKRLFGKRILVEVTKSSLKFIIIAGIAAYFIYHNGRELFELPYLTFDSAMINLFILIEHFVITLLAGVIIISSIDAIYTFFDYHKRIKMTTQEIKDEAKQAEGSPEVKRKMRQMMIKILRQKVKVLVPQADVIITNPTHYAIALRYREGIDSAPKVIAKGKGVMAQYIRSLAVSKGVPIYEAPPLARALFHTTKLGSEVKPALYVAVALVLSYINQMRGYQMGRGPMPKKADQLEIPPEYRFDS